jgi:lysophospholipase L1-like esterase
VRIAFFGDSLTQGVPGAAYFPLLQERFPRHELINQGIGGDTVLSLYRRISNARIEGPWDIAFLWVGVNDVLVQVSWTYPLLKRIRRQPWLRDLSRFGQEYRILLSYLSDRSGHVVAVPPLFIGEDLGNPWNLKLESLSRQIEAAAHDFSKVDYLDLRTGFRPLLSGRSCGAYRPRNAARILLDVFTQGGSGEEESRRRELLFTLDGVHLNTAGAEIVADAFARKIEDREAVMPGA